MGAEDLIVKSLFITDNTYILPVGGIKKIIY